MHGVGLGSVVLMYRRCLSLQHSFLKDVRSAWKTNPHADSSFEFITLNGLECKVPKWFKHSAGSDFWEVFFWVSMMCG